MKKLSLMTVLLLSSSMVCAEWITTGKDYKGACREMMCDCVEDEAGNGYCCPSGTSLVNTGNSHTTYTPCKCPENQTWDTTTSSCVECVTDEDCEGELVCGADKVCICPSGTSQYTNYLGNKSCCNTTTHVLVDVTGTTNKACCPSETPVWDATSNTCVSDKVCAILYKNKNKIGTDDERYISGECCEPEQKLVTDRANTLFEGYKSEDERYGCCLAENVYTKLDDTTACCNPETHVLLDMTGTTQKACCPLETPVWEECKPGYCSVCASGNELAGVAFDSTKMLQDAGCQCSCNTEAGYNLHQLSDGTYGCLPYCTKNSGIFLLVDRSGSTFDDKGSARMCDNSKDPCYKINKLLKGLDLSGRNYALYNEETSGCGYNQAMSMLPFGQHSSSEYDLWNDVYYKPKCNDSSGTYFDKALAHIRNKYCEEDEPIVIMIITDGQVQDRRDDMASYMNTMIRTCNAKIVYVGPDGSKLEKSMDKYMNQFDSYDFDSSVQSWISATNDAINDSCIPRSGGSRTPSRSDSSWFCNVLEGSEKSYLHLTKKQCFSCSGQTKFRWHNEQDKWGGYGASAAGVCCGSYSDAGSCKESKYDWEYD